MGVVDIGKLFMRMGVFMIGMRVLLSFELFVVFLVDCMRFYGALCNVGKLLKFQKGCLVGFFF